MSMTGRQNICEGVTYFDIDHLTINGWKGNLSLPAVKHEMESGSELLLEINLIERQAVVHVKDPYSEIVQDVVIINSGTVEGGGNLEIHKFALLNGEEVRIMLKYAEEDKFFSLNIFMYGKKSAPSSKLCDAFHAIIEMCMKGHKNNPPSHLTPSGSIPNNDLQVLGVVRDDYVKVVGLKSAQWQKRGFPARTIARPSAKGLTLRITYSSSDLHPNPPTSIILEWSTVMDKLTSTHLLAPGYDYLTPTTPSPMNNCVDLCIFDPASPNAPEITATLETIFPMRRSELKGILTTYGY